MPTPDLGWQKASMHREWYMSSPPQATPGPGVAMWTPRGLGDIGASNDVSLGRHSRNRVSPSAYGSAHRPATDRQSLRRGSMQPRTERWLTCPAVVQPTRRPLPPPNLGRHGHSTARCLLSTPRPTGPHAERRVSRAGSHAAELQVPRGPPQPSPAAERGPPCRDRRFRRRVSRAGSHAAELQVPGVPSAEHCPRARAAMPGPALERTCLQVGPNTARSFTCRAGWHSRPGGPFRVEAAFTVDIPIVSG